MLRHLWLKVHPELRPWVLLSMVVTSANLIAIAIVLLLVYLLVP